MNVRHVVDGEPPRDVFLHEDRRVPDTDIEHVEARRKISSGVVLGTTDMALAGQILEKIGLLHLKDRPCVEVSGGDDIAVFSLPRRKGAGELKLCSPWLG